MWYVLLACAAPPEDSGAECEYLDPGTRLDITGGCVDGMCLGSTYPEVVALWGDPDGCAVVSREAECVWGDVAVTFPDCDDDGAPDEEYVCDLFGQTLTITGGWDGSSPEGLGLGVTAECWEAVLGADHPYGWQFGQAKWWAVTVEPAAGAVTEIRIDWSYDE